MVKSQTFKEECNIVLLGNFQPSIFHPSWFALTGLLSEEDCSKAEVEVVTPVITQFRIADWLGITVDEHKLIVKSIHIDRKDILKDLVIGICKILKYYQVSALGINVIKHIDLKESEKRNNLGITIIPTNFWEDKLTNPVLRVADVQGESFSDNFKGYTKVRVEPSAINEIHKTGVRILVNSHFNIENENTDLNQMMIVVDILEKDFDNCFSMSNEIIEKFLNFGD